jgi:hypothetical protein
MENFNEPQLADFHGDILTKLTEAYDRQTQSAC